MKQLIFMIVVALIGVGGSLTVSPFYGVAVYYLFAVLRPQFIWKWSLPTDIPWSFYVAVAAMIGLALNGRRPRWRRRRFQQIADSRPLDRSCLRRLGVAHLLHRAHHEVAYPYFVEYLKLFLMFWVAGRVIQTPRQVWLLYLLTAGTLGYIAYEINWIYFFHNRSLTSTTRIRWSRQQRGGLMLAMGVPLCYFAFEGIRKWFRWAFVALIPLIVHAVLTSYSRGAMCLCWRAFRFSWFGAAGESSSPWFWSPCPCSSLYSPARRFGPGSSPWKTPKRTRARTAAATAGPRPGR